MPRKQVALFGFGYVGRALHRFLKDHYDVVVIDPHVDFAAMSEAHDPECPERWGKDYSCAAGIEHAVVCVPTQMRDDGSCDTSIVEDVLNNTDCKSYLVKSTVSPGTIDRLIAETGKRICHSPEYIGEGKYEVKWWKGHPHPTQMRLHDFHIFGGPRDVTAEWVDIWLPIVGPNVVFRQCSALEAEVTKYTENVWGAMKVTWANEMFEICEKLGVDWREIRELWALDGRVEKMHTAVFKDKRGWAGKCYPKDLMAMIKHAQKRGYEPELLKEVVRSNARFSTDENMKKLPESL